MPDDFELVGSFRGRVYLNLTQFMSIASGIPILSPDTLFVMAGGGGVELVKGIYEERSPAEFIKRLPLTLPRILTSQLSMPLLAPVWGAYFAGKREDFFQRDLERFNHSKFRSLLDKVDRLFNRNGQIMLAGSSNFPDELRDHAQIPRVASAVRRVCRTSASWSVRWRSTAPSRASTCSSWAAWPVDRGVFAGLSVRDPSA